MPIVSRIGRRQWKVRALLYGICAVLLVGAVTMVYPVLLMLSGSTKSAVDTPNPRVIPRFLVSERALWQKHVEGLFNESIEMMRQVYDVDAGAFDKVNLPGGVNREFAGAWLDFLSERRPEHYYSVGYLRSRPRAAPCPRRCASSRAPSPDASTTTSRR